MASARRSNQTPTARACAAHDSIGFISARNIVAAGQAAQRPADVLPRAAYAGELAVEVVMVVEVLEQPALDVDDARRRERRAGREVMGDLAEDPRSPLGGAADHDRVGAGLREHCARLRRRVDVAVGDDRDRDRALDRGDRLVLGVALVALLARAAVHRDHRDAGAPRRRGRCAPRSSRSRTSRCASSASPARCAARTRRRPPRRSRSASDSSFISAEPAHWLHTFLAGQPMLMSMICAPRATL